MQIATTKKKCRKISGPPVCTSEHFKVPFFALKKICVNPIENHVSNFMQSESAVMHITFLVFYIVVSDIFNVTFSWKPHKNLFISSSDKSS